MQHAIDYSELLHRIAERFEYRYDDDPSRHVRMVGIIFARPNSPITKADILPQINDWHYRSGDHIDFYFAGYTASSDGAPGYIEVSIPGSRPWDYSALHFEAFREEFELRSKWKHSGSAELLLLNANFEPQAKEVRLDFTSLVCCQLDLMKSDQAIQSVERFFESVFRFAEAADDTDPTWSFSDRQGINIAGSALKRVVLSLLPRGVEAEYRKAEHFAVRDVSRV
jgi:hypothetical protein